MSNALILTVFREEEQIARHEFERDIVKIGRLASAHLKLEDTKISRIHAVIETAGDQPAVIDMGSSEGTFVNGKKVSKQRLAEGDEIRVGDHRIIVSRGGLEAPTPRTGDMASEDILHAEVAAPAPYGYPQGQPYPSVHSVVPPNGLPAVAPVASTIPYEGVLPQPAAEAPAWTEAPVAYPTPDLASEGYHPGWVPPPSVPNNLASSGVPEDERALEVKLIWGNSVLETVTATDQPQVTLGDEQRVSGLGPLQRIVRCDLEVPSAGLPSATHVLAERHSKNGTVYVLNLPPGLVGRVERADGTLVTLDLLYAGQHGGKPNGEGGARYLVRPEETIYLGYGHLVLQVRYVRRTQLTPVLPFSRMNYMWANTLILAVFFHVMAIGSFLATPEVTANLSDELFKNRNRFIQTRLKLAEQTKKSGGLLEELKGPGEKAKRAEGKAGKRDARKANGRLATKGKPDRKERARKLLDNLLGLGGKGRTAGIFSGRGLGGDLVSAMGSLQGRKTGDARGLGGLGTRGTGPGGGGLAYDGTGLGDLNTAGRGGGQGGSGYGRGASSLGGKKERDIDISAGQAVIRGSLSKEIIRRVIQKHQAQIRYCYEKELQRSPGLYGKVATEFIIDASGRVTTAKVYQTTMKSPPVERCITSKIRTWQFPKPKGGGIVVVKYPFLFKASG